MKLKIALGLGTAIFTLAGVSLTSINETYTPFVDPLVFSRSICNSGDQITERRAFFISAARAYAQAPEEASKKAPISFSTFGDIAYDVSTTNEIAQTLFNRGLALTWNFNHSEAIKAFKAAQTEDPTCAMCYWGEAFALGPNINAPMDPDANKPAYEAINRAIANREYATTKEQTLIDALQKRYSKTAPEDRSALDNAFADEMNTLAEKFPDDDLVATLAAEANMDTQAWDYWESNGIDGKGRTAKTISLIEGVLARNPNHPAAIHLYIHITEASQNPHRAADYADKLAGLSPDLGHLIHMPSHTYYRIGRFKESLASNVAAIAADEEYIAAHDASILYEFGYFTHNLHFAMTSAQLAGDGETAIAMAKKLDSKLPLDMASAAPWVQPIKAAPYYAMVQFAPTSDILALPNPGSELPFLQGAWHYAQGEALARTGDLTGARHHAEAIGDIIVNADFAGFIDGGVPVIDILNIARLTIQARAALAENDLNTAIEALEDATAMQDTLAYTEPPYWYYPVKQTLAATLIKAGQAERAEHLLIETLAKTPNNGWVLFGLSKSYAAQGNKRAAKYANNLFKDAWAGNTKEVSLDRL